MTYNEYLSALNDIKEAYTTWKIDDEEYDKLRAELLEFYGCRCNMTEVG